MQVRLSIYFLKNVKKEVISDDNYFIRKRQSEKCMCFEHEIKCAYRLTAENENQLPIKKIRNQYIIW